jgi:hypothetical protein
LAAAARTLPGHRKGTSCDPSTLWRWGRKGVKRPDGVIVYLELARLGSKWVTSLEALQRFSDRLTTPPDDPSAAPQTPAHRQREADRAGRELDNLGI